MNGSLHDRILVIADRAAGELPAARAIAERLRGPLAVALAGRVNAGKSTLVNALLGERLALTDATECTRLVTRYVHGQIYGAAAAGANGAAIPLPFERDPEGLRVAIDAVGRGSAPITITAPNPALLGMTLIDTPGLGSEDEARVAGANAALGMGEPGSGQADAVVYLLRHAHRSDVDTLEALRDRWAGNGSAFNVVAVLSRADEIGGGRLDAMTSASTVAERYESDGRLRGLAARVIPVSGLLAETGATLREEEFSRLRTFASGPTTEVDRLLLASPLFLQPAATALTLEVRRELMKRFGLFGLRLAVAEMRSGSVADAPGLARALVGASGLALLRRALTEQFGGRSQQLKSLSAIDALQQLAHHERSQGIWLRELEEVESGAHELAEIRALQACTDGLLQLTTAEQRRLTLLLAEASAGNRLGLPADAAAAEIRQAALSAIDAWRTAGANPMLNRATVEACETAARAAEALFATL